MYAYVYVCVRAGVRKSTHTQFVRILLNMPVHPRKVRNGTCKSNVHAHTNTISQPTKLCPWVFLNTHIHTNMRAYSPTHNYASLDRSLRQVKYNLVVYDLEQVSREIDEIMFLLSQDKEYEGLTEPAVSQYDDVLASTLAGVRKAAEVCGSACCFHHGNVLLCMYVAACLYLRGFCTPDLRD
jgi:hypothetical protein